MLTRFARAGDALLRRLVPSTTASAQVCWTFCSTDYCEPAYNIRRTKRTCCSHTCTTTNVRCGC